MPRWMDNVQCRYTGTRDDGSGSGGNQIVYYLHSKVLLIYFRYQYFPVQVCSIEWAFEFGTGTHLFYSSRPRECRHISEYHISGEQGCNSFSTYQYKGVCIDILTNSMSWDSRSPNFTSTVSLLLLTGRINRL